MLVIVVGSSCQSQFALGELAELGSQFVDATDAAATAAAAAAGVVADGV